MIVIKNNKKLIKIITINSKKTKYNLSELDLNQLSKLIDFLKAYLKLKRTLVKNLKLILQVSWLPNKK